MTHRKRQLTRSRIVLSALGLSALGLVGAALAFAAGPPLISGTAVSEIATTSATFEASLNTNGREVTEHHFEYVDQASFEAGGFAAAKSTPSGPPIPDTAGNVAVSASVSGLAPGTVYRYRLLATNAKGKAAGPDASFATYATAPSFAHCPNDSFRGGPGARLPDCRAYEQASPVNKDAGDATGIFYVIKAALGGDAVTFLSTAGVPGGVGAQELPLYLASRGSAGWSSQGLLPPATLGQRARVLGWTPDLTKVFTVASKFASPFQLNTMLQRSADGSIATIAPYQAQAGYFFADTSADGSEVVFESPGKLPSVGAALEGASNVYAWDAAGGKLSLAGVLNDGSSPPKGAFAGPYDWVHGTTPGTLEHGGALSRYYLHDEHAISADGSVYFTAAGTGQLYLRRNPTQEQSPLQAGKCTVPAKACTIRISASQKEHGKGPDGTDAAGPRPAAFMAAGADGSKAFFTSSEKLTDDANTGVEPELPAIARADIGGGSGTDLSFIPTTASAVAVDGAHVYWTDPEAGTIGRADLDGDPASVEPEFIGAADAGSPRWVAVDGDHIYWTNTGEPDAEGKFQDGHGTIGRADLDGDPASVDPEFITGASNPQGIAVDATHIYWANGGNTGNRGIGRADIGGGGVNQSFVNEWNASGLAVNATHIYWIAGNLVSNGGCCIFRANIDGSGFKSIVGGDSDKRLGLALDGSHIYWTEPDTGRIGRSNLDGSGVEGEFITGAAHPGGLAVDAGHLYWSANQGALPNPGNDLYRYDAATGKLSDLTVDGTHPNGAEVKGVLGASDDGSYLYFVANGVFPGTTNSPNANGESATFGDCKGNLGAMSGTCNLYLWHEGAIGFIARLDVSGSLSRTDAANWAPTASEIDTGVLNFRKTASVSPDGRTLLFRSQRRLDGYENAGTPELYRYRAGEAGVSCVSCNPTQAPPTGFPSLGTLLTSSSIPQTPAAVASRNLAAGGNRVFFESTDALVAEDTNGEAGCPLTGTSQQSFPACLDVYEWEAKGTGTCQSEAQNGGCLYLLSSGKSPYPSFFADASAGGEDAFIFTRQGLVGQDGDELLDVYDARVGGGLASQSPAVPNPCPSVEACHGPTPPEPAGDSPATTNFSGPPDPKPKHLNKSKKAPRQEAEKRHGKKQRKKHHRRSHAEGRARR